MKIRSRNSEEFRQTNSFPKNWRTHPTKQADVLKGLLAEPVSTMRPCPRTPAGLVLIDGHLRCETAANAMIPVLVIDVNDEEAKLWHRWIR